MVRSLMLVALVLGCASVADALMGVLHTPPGHSASGEPVAILVELEGVDGRALTVSVHYREVGSGRFIRELLAEGVAGQFSGEIPATATTGLALRYYLEVIDDAGVRVFRLGSERSALAVELFEAQALAASGVRGRDAVVLAAVSGLLLATALVLRWRSRQRVMATRTDLFWVQTLLPVTALPNPHITSALRQLAGELLNHPSDGLRRFSQGELVARFREVRQANLAELRARADRLLPGRPRVRGLDYRLTDTDPGTIVERRSESEFVGINSGAFAAVQTERRQRQATEMAEDAAILESIGIIADYGDQLATPPAPLTELDPDWELAPLADGRPVA